MLLLVVLFSLVVVLLLVFVMVLLFDRKREICALPRLKIFLDDHRVDCTRQVTWYIVHVHGLQTVI